MNEESFYIGTLAKKLVTGQLTSGESNDLEEWMAVYPWRREMIDRIIEQEKITAGLAGFEKFNEDEMRSRIVSYFDTAGYSAGTHRIHFLKTAWVRYAAAILILLGVGIYFYTHSRKPSTTRTSSTLVKNDVRPGNDKATLTLSNGQTIQLSGDTSETIKDGALSIENGQGQLSYKNAAAAVMNTMSTPKGGQYQLTLSDGSRVWLNAASSITYPTSFIGKTREVTVTGEAYFEIAKDKIKPFIVKTNNNVITVIGTSFNVNNYNDEPAAKTSLVEGAIRINDKILQPGQAYSGGKVVATNIEQDIAWKNGIFDFDQLSVEQMVRQLARWYDLDIKFEGAIPKEKIFGQVDRKITLNELLKGYEGELAHFRLEGKTLFVKAL